MDPTSRGSWPSPDARSAAERLAAVVKAYDVRGPSPEALDAELTRALAAAFAVETGIAGGGGRAVVGRDVRVSSPDLAAAVVAGITAAGADIVDIGLASTDQLYAASGLLEAPGVMVTASHNPPGDNGLKLCRGGAEPLGRDTGLGRIVDRAVAVLRRPELVASAGSAVGRVETVDILPAYVDLLLRLAPVRGRRLRVVVDAGNGMAGLTVPAVVAQLDVELIGLYLEPDGTFPHHPPDPLDPANLVELSERVVAERADLGLAFDGDADRCFVVDERGEPVSPSTITALIATRELAREPGATVLHNVVCSRAVPEIVIEHGGVPVRTPVGHSLIKATMARTGAVFGGEHSGHFYFRDFFRADSGLLAALHVMAALAASTATVSELMGPYRRYVGSGELNTRVDDPQAAMARVEKAIAATGTEVATDRLDGLTVSTAEGWFSLRPSNTESLLRLNVEAADQASMIALRDRVLHLIRAGSTG